MDRPEGRVVESVIHGQKIMFFVQNEGDAVQGYHARGKFYEAKDLLLIAKHFPENGSFIDIGANVGNHTVFVSKFLRPSFVKVFEPSPEAIGILRQNLSLNGLADLVDTSNVGVGVGDVETTVAFKRGSTNNLGASKFVPIYAGNSINIKTADSMMNGIKANFIKIDVEGMEISVLNGLSETIRNNRPIIYIEIDDRNKKYFDLWVAENDYDVVEQIRHYSVNENFLIYPKETMPPLVKHRVGIAVITYNRKEQLVRTLQAVKKYTDSPYYLVVADDGSSDGSRDAAIDLGATVIGDANQGIAWNKNRALFALLENTDCSSIIMLEDDTLPTQFGWERAWVAAASRLGYVTHAHPKISSAILCGSGTPDDPFGCLKITSQCAAASREAITQVGYFDTRFKGYGVEDGEWTTRFRTLGYGIVRAMHDGKSTKANAMIRGGVETVPAVTFRDNANVERNRKIFQEVRNDPVPRPAWRSPRDRAILLAEVNKAVRRHPLQVFFPPRIS